MHRLPPRLRRLALWTAALLALVAAGTLAYVGGRWVSGATRAPDLGGTELRNPPQLDEALVDATGARRTLAEIVDQEDRDMLLVFFGFTRCPDVCPITLARLAEAYRDAGEPDDIGIVMITVDPEYDTPERVQRYVEGFHPDFLGLSGETGAVARAARSFYIGVRIVGEGEVDHTDVVAVVDADGRMRRIYGQLDLVELVRDLPRLSRSL